MNSCIRGIERAPSLVEKSGREEVLSALKNSGKNIVTARPTVLPHQKYGHTVGFFNVNNTVTSI